jgi:hypothetical protein
MDTPTHPPTYFFSFCSTFERDGWGKQVLVSWSELRSTNKWTVMCSMWKARDIKFCSQGTLGCRDQTLEKGWVVLELQEWWLTGIAHSGTLKSSRKDPGFKPGCVQVKFLVGPLLPLSLTWLCVCHWLVRFWVCLLLLLVGFFFLCSFNTQWVSSGYHEPPPPKGYKRRRVSVLENISSKICNAHPLWMKSYDEKHALKLP